jgi:hypothetical protein
MTFHLKGMGWEDLEWIRLAQKRNHCGVLVNVVIKVPVYKNSGKFVISLEIISLRITIHVHAVSSAVNESVV